MRWIVAIAFAAAVSFALPMSMEAVAAKKPKNKLCTGMSLAGAKVDFKCKADEKCCFDVLISKGNCIAASAVCL